MWVRPWRIRASPHPATSVGRLKESYSVVNVSRTADTLTESRFLGHRAAFVREKRVELLFTAPEAAVLPLDDSRIETRAVVLPLSRLEWCRATVVPRLGVEPRSIG